MATRHSFTVVIDGIELDTAVLERVEAAIQKAALMELADLDLKGDFAARIGDGGTQGITLVALRPEHVAKAGLDQLLRGHEK